MNGSNCEQTTLDALKRVEEYAEAISSRRVDPTARAQSKTAIETAMKSGLPEKERGALLQALLSVVDAVNESREIGLEIAALEAKTLSEAASLKRKERSKRVRYCVGAACSLTGAFTALCFKAELPASVAFALFSAFIAPELIVGIRGLLKFVLPR